MTLGCCNKVLYNDECHTWAGYESCGADVCWLSDYEACRDAQGNLSFEQTSANEPVLTCNALLPYPGLEFCYQFREALRHRSPPVASKIVVGGPAESGAPSVCESGQGVELFPNPLTGFATIRCAGGDADRAVLEISSVSGDDALWSEPVRETGGMLEAELDLSPLAVGSYGDRLLASDIPLCSGVLTIAR